MHLPIGELIELRTPRASAEIGTLAAVLARPPGRRPRARRTHAAHASAGPTGSGIVLAPWPNRVRDARWTHRRRRAAARRHRSEPRQRHPRPAAQHRLPRARALGCVGAAGRRHPPPARLAVPARHLGALRARRRRAHRHPRRAQPRRRAPPRGRSARTPTSASATSPSSRLTLEVRGARYLELDDQLVPVAVHDGRARRRARPEQPARRSAISISTSRTRTSPPAPGEPPCSPHRTVTAPSCGRTRPSAGCRSTRRATSRTSAPTDPRRRRSPSRSSR